MNDEPVQIASRYQALAAFLIGLLLSIFMGFLSWGFSAGSGERHGRPIPNRELTGALFAFISVLSLWIASSYARGFSSATLNGRMLTIRQFRRSWEIPVEQVTSVERIASPFRGVYALRLVFDERSPIRDAMLDVSWLEEPVGSIEDLIEQAKRWAGRNAPYRPAS